MRPGVVAKFAGLRNGVKNPAKLSGANVEGANVAGRSGKSFRIAAADDDQVFENQAGTGEVNGIGGSRFAAEIFAKVDASGIAEIGNGFAGGGVERVKKIRDADEDASVGTGTPIGEAAIRLGTFDAGIEFPEEFSGGGVEREDFLRWE